MSKQSICSDRCLFLSLLLALQQLFIINCRRRRRRRPPTAKEISRAAVCARSYRNHRSTTYTQYRHLIALLNTITELLL